MSQSPIILVEQQPPFSTGAAPVTDVPSVVESMADESARPETVASRLGSIGRFAGRMASVGEWIFGCATLVVGLAVLATLPVLQLLSFGYLLEVAGRVAREGRLSAAAIGVRKAARLGGIVLAVWLLLWPLRFVSLLSSSARLIEPGGSADRFWTATLWLLTALFVAHVVSACLAGGRLRNFLWPRPIALIRRLRAHGAYTAARDAVWEFVSGLRLPYYFWLGLRGFLAGLAWLIVPISLLAAGRSAPVLGLIGGLLLTGVVMYLPFLQARFAAENRLRAMFDVRAVRSDFRRAPLAFLVALAATLVLALPLYLLKIEMIPREAAWLPSLLFVAFIGPARLLTGWAEARSKRRVEPCHWSVCWLARLAILPAAVLYVVIVYFTQFTSWYGLASLYEQHAFLLPVPFLGF